MSYCTISQMRALMHKSVTIGSLTLVNQAVIQSQGKADTVTPETAQLFIQFATQYINSRLRSFYFCPLKKIKVLEMSLVADADAGKMGLEVEDATRFYVGAQLRVRDNSSSGLYVIKQLYEDDPTKAQIIDLNRKLDTSFTVAATGSVALLDYPDPIPSMCARFAVSMLIDKEFVGEQSPDVSNFGKTQRTLAANDMDDILNGTIRLEGQDHTGRRFYRGSLRDTPSATSVTVTQRGAGTGKEV